MVGERREDGEGSEKRRENLKYLLIYFLFNEIYSRIFQVPSWMQSTTALGHKPVRTLKVLLFFWGLDMCNLKCASSQASH